MNRLPSHVLYSKWQKAVDADIDDFCYDKYLEKGFGWMKVGCIWSKMWRSMSAKAVRQCTQKIGKKYFGYWKIFADFSKNMEDFLTNKYWQKVKRKILKVLWQEADDKKNYLVNLARKQASDAEDAEQAKLTMIIMLRGL